MNFEKKILTHFQNEKWLNTFFFNNINYKTLKKCINYNYHKIISSNKDIYRVESIWLPDIIGILIACYLADKSLIIDHFDKYQVCQLNFSKQQLNEHIEIKLLLENKKKGFIRIDKEKYYYKNIDLSIKNIYKLLKNIKDFNKFSLLTTVNITSIIILFWIFLEGKTICNIDNSQFNFIQDKIYTNYYLDIKNTHNSYILVDITTQKNWSANLFPIGTILIVCNKLDLIGKVEILNNKYKYICTIPNPKKEITFIDNTLKVINTQFLDIYQLNKGKYVIETSIYLPAKNKQIVLQALVLVFKKYPILGFSYTQDLSKLIQDTSISKKWINIIPDSLRLHQLFQTISENLNISRNLSCVTILENNINEQFRIIISYSSVLDYLYPIINKLKQILISSFTYKNINIISRHQKISNNINSYHLTPNIYLSISYHLLNLLINENQPIVPFNGIIQKNISMDCIESIIDIISKYKNKYLIIVWENKKYIKAVFNKLKDSTLAYSLLFLSYLNDKYSFFNSNNLNIIHIHIFRDFKNNWLSRVDLAYSKNKGNKNRQYLSLYVKENNIHLQGNIDARLANFIKKYQ